MNNHSALILVDLQNDFFPGGSLGVPGANAIFPLANEIQTHFQHVIATKDWHPKNHGSFASQNPNHAIYDLIDLKGLPQILWPDHCVQDTLGAQFHPKLKTTRFEKIIFKGTHPEIDSYSTFFDNAHQKSTGLADYLREHKINTLYFMGLATDYCVLYSVLDAAKLGFKAFVIQDGCFGLNKNPGDVDKAFKEMEAVGATLVHSTSIQDEQS